MPHLGHCLVTDKLDLQLCMLIITVAYLIKVHYFLQVGNHIDVQTGKWTAVDAGIGAGVDSYFEYLVKGSILFQNANLKLMFNG